MIETEKEQSFILISPFYLSVFAYYQHYHGEATYGCM